MEVTIELRAMRNYQAYRHLLLLVLLTTAGCTEPDQKGELESFVDDLEKDQSNQLSEMSESANLIAGRSLTPAKTILAWEEFMKTYPDDIPDTLEDQELRKKATSYIHQAKVSRIEEFYPEYYVEAKPLIDSILLDQPQHIGALSLLYRFSHLRNDEIQMRIILNMVLGMKDRMSHDQFLYRTGKALLGEDVDSAYELYAKIEDTNIFPISERSQYEQTKLSRMFDESVRLARSSMVKGNTQEALGLAVTIPSDAKAWINRFGGQSSVFKVLDETSQLDGHFIFVTGNQESVRIAFAQKETIVRREDEW